jgi:hypothetical protein
MANPPAAPIPKHRWRSLFGSCYSREYHAWYYRTQQACKALPTHEQNWPEFFAKAKEVEMRKQGLLPKATNVVPLNPKSTLTGTSSSKSEPQGSAPSMDDERLMFDFNVDNAEDRGWR